MFKSGVIAVDDGGYSTCIVTKDCLESFPSVKGDYGERTLTNTSGGKHDFIVDYKGARYAMGNLAKYDCRYPLQMHTSTKQHLFFDLSVLVAIHQYGYASNFLITSVPISQHKDNEKLGRINRLQGEHTITVNEVTRRFNITEVKVAPETAVAFWIHEPQGKTRFIDLGSRTIGYATTINEGGVTRFIDSESDTISGKGLEALGKNYNQKALADYICGRLLSVWDDNDTVYILGGGANDDILVSFIKEYFKKAKVLDNPHMVNAIGMYRLGRFIYDMA